MKWFASFISVAVIAVLVVAVYFSAHDPFYWWLEFQRLVDGDEQLLLIILLTLVVGIAISQLTTTVNENNKGLRYSWIPFAAVFLVLYLIAA